MTVIRPNSISGITSITAQGDTVNFFKSDGNSAGLQLNGVNFNTTTGVSTFLSLVVTGNVSIAGTLTYEDVTNVDSIGIVTARSGVRIDAGGIVVVGVTTVAAGTVAAPSISPTGDSDTGIFFPSADTIAFGEGGAEAASNPGSYSSSANNLVVQDTAGEGGITIVSSTTAGSNIFFADTDGTAQGQIKYQHNGDYMRFYTNATERLRIDSSGRLGIGTGSPSQLLDVVGNSASVKVTETGGADVRITAGGFTGFFGTYSNHPLQILTNSTNAVHITSAGLVGIGTNSPSSDGPLTLSNSATTPTIFFERESTNYNGAIQCSAYGTITFYNGADSSVVSGLTPRMTIDGQYGNVGIGTVTPRRTLEVSGADGLFCLNATDTSTGTSQLLFGDTDDDNIGRIYYDHANNAMAFYTNTSERMRIGSDGILYLGATSTVSTIANARLQVIGSNAATFLGDSGLAYQQVVYIHHNNTKRRLQPCCGPGPLQRNF
jgi:hypothetical protein